MCERCGSPVARNESEHGRLCDGCAFRQSFRDEQRETFAALCPSTFGFDRYDDDPYD